MKCPLWVLVSGRLHHSQYYQRRPMGPYSPPPLSTRSSSSSLRPSASADKQTHYGHLDSCDVCFDDNFKCDRRKPQCSRCVSLNFACHYNQRPLSLHRPQGANVQQRSRQPQHSQHPQPQPNPLGSPLEEAAMLAEPTSAPTVPASGPGFVPSQRRALAFSTIVLPPLPTQGTSRVNALSTYAALNQHLDTLPDVALPPATRPTSLESGSSTRFAPLSNSPVGSPPRSHDRPAAAPARKLSDRFNYPNPQSQNHIFPNYEASRRHVVGDVRLLAELFGSIRFINQVITRYEGASLHIEIPGHRTGYDKAGLEAATRGMSVELKDKLIQVLQDVACLRYPT
ncbi:hypothetical protein CFIMG_007821RA00001 [Ceratocystis fimbriata CBS 114723]|uniref:Zn(2)-C6 fungal-type domain-containing protein n=1 Tax=Ceratocystis fimbriata CBS 114723 TaxID=1035309 RepID=A0A2C5W193_9PEZI|nr:hypothetical protein CFIMG_007821RA00001 [Ceratocystis fimbriata CBS 114723]